MAEWLRRTLDQEVGVSNPELDSNLLPLFLVSGWWALSHCEPRFPALEECGTQRLPPPLPQVTGRMPCIYLVSPGSKRLTMIS